MAAEGWKHVANTHQRLWVFICLLCSPLLTGFYSTQGGAECFISNSNQHPCGGSLKLKTKIQPLVHGYSATGRPSAWHNLFSSSSSLAFPHPSLMFPSP